MKFGSEPLHFKDRINSATMLGRCSTHQSSSYHCRVLLVLAAVVVWISCTSISAQEYEAIAGWFPQSDVQNDVRGDDGGVSNWIVVCSRNSGACTIHSHAAACAARTPPTMIETD
jgi:hypothetical protein